jgi:excisionase family DNA binding protein
MYIESKPLFTLTIGEFIAMTRELVNEALMLKEKEKKQAVEDAPNREEHFNILELAKFLKCSKVSIHKYKKKGLPFYRIGRKLLFKKTEVLNFMKSLRNKRVVQG